MADLGSNPVLLDGKLVITPHPWLAPIENSYKQLEEEYLKVRTQPERIEKAAIAAIHSSWLELTYTDRTFFERPINEAAIYQIRQVLDEEA